MRGCDLELIGYVFLAGGIDGFVLQVVFLVFGLHRPAEYYLTLMHEDSDVVSAGGERLVMMNGFPDLLGESAVGGIHFLLIRGRGYLVRVHLRAIRTRLWGGMPPKDWRGHQRYAKNQRAER